MVNLINKNKKIIINIIYSLLTYLAISIYTNLSFYNIFSIVLFIIILYFYNKNSIETTGKIKKYSIVLSLFFSLTLSIGNIVSKNLLLSNIGFLNYKNIFYIFIILVGLFILFYKLSLLLFNNINKVNILENKKTKKLTTKSFIIMFILIFASWFIIFLRFFPAIMTPDSFYVIHNANEIILSDHHTFGHTWFFAFFFYIGKTIFSNLNAGVAVYTIFQMLIIDTIFVLTIKYFYNKGLKKSICYLLTIIFALNPLYSFYSVTLWRDILFGMSFIIVMMCLYDYVNNNFKIEKGKIILFTLAIIIMLFFRNNGIYVFIFMSIFIILIGSKKRVSKIIYCVSIISLYFIIKGPIFDYFGVHKGLQSEAYSIPIQQISRVVASNEKIKKSDYKQLKKIYNVERAKTEYNPIISDKMKETINNDYVNKNKSKLIKVYLSLLKEHPLIYVEAYFTQTVGYWYPDIQYWATAGESVGMFEKEIKTTPLLPKKINKLIDKVTSRKIPFSILIWGVGLYVELLIISTIISMYKFGKNIFLCYAPFYGLLFTILIASPVFCELRYVYGIFCSMPFIILIPFIKKGN